MAPNVWINLHVKVDKSKVTNSIKFIFCVKCFGKNTVTDQAKCGLHYKSNINNIKNVVKVSYVGTIEVRIRIPSGVVFIEEVIETIKKKRLNLKIVKIVIKPVMVPVRMMVTPTPARPAAEPEPDNQGDDVQLDDHAQHQVQADDDKPNDVHDDANEQANSRTDQTMNNDNRITTIDENTNCTIDTNTVTATSTNVDSGSPASGRRSATSSPSSTSSAKSSRTSTGTPRRPGFNRVRGGGDAGHARRVAGRVTSP
ncbi:hypothetical protein F4859DRAFT_518452 [Xylaria cf. heliscus]|nr:hypothetical protein F4859DRAFT_518452 [Xylaria cf. heliscus]